MLQTPTGRIRVIEARLAYGGQTFGRVNLCRIASAGLELRILSLAGSLAGV